MAVAERLYFNDRAEPPPSALRPDLETPFRFHAEVTDIREDSRVDGHHLWQLALDRTAFYPTGGGQPCDLGHLEAVARSGARLDVPVLRVEEDDAGEVWHFVPKPLAAGTRVTGFLDAARREDHAQQHTGQHLLSAILLRELHAPTVSFHLGEESSTIDLASLTPDGQSLDGLDNAALTHIEAEVNRAVAADLPVRARWVERAEAEAMLADGRLRKLPERSGPIRLVEIQGIESNACGGTHVTSTGRIGGLTLRRVERVRQGLRLEFCCGLRAVRSARRDFDLLAESARTLSAAPADVPGKLTRLLQEGKAATKERSSLLEEMADLEARLVVAGAGGPEGAGLMEVLLVERDVPYARLLAAKIVAQAPAAVVIVAATESSRATLILARGARSTLDCAQAMRSATAAAGTRGGGSADLAQGSVSVELLDEMVRALRNLSGF